MRVCVLPFIAALAIPAFAAPVHTRVPDSSDSYAQIPVFNTISQYASSLTASTAAGLDRLTGHDAPRTIAYWTVIDLEMFAISDRIEASPLLRDGLASADDLTNVLALN
jgi:hypothetical protein